MAHIASIGYASLQSLYHYVANSIPPAIVSAVTNIGKKALACLSVGSAATIYCFYEGYRHRCHNVRALDTELGFLHVKIALKELNQFTGSEAEKKAHLIELLRMTKAVRNNTLDKPLTQLQIAMELTTIDPQQAYLIALDIAERTHFNTEIVTRLCEIAEKLRTNAPAASTGLFNKMTAVLSGTWTQPQIKELFDKVSAARSERPINLINDTYSYEDLDHKKRAAEAALEAYKKFQQQPKEEQKFEELKTILICYAKNAPDGDKQLELMRNEFESFGQSEGTTWSPCKWEELVVTYAKSCCPSLSRHIDRLLNEHQLNPTLGLDALIVLQMLGGVGLAQSQRQILLDIVVNGFDQTTGIWSYWHDSLKVGELIKASLVLEDPTKSRQILQKYQDRQGLRYYGWGCIAAIGTAIALQIGRA